ncbi:MAG TPA: MMPL family transporter [Planctomycetota bacterium]
MTRYPKATLLIAAVLTAAAIAGLTRFRVDSNLEHLFPADDPTLKLTRHLQGDAPPTRALFVVTKGDPGAAADALRASPHVAAVAATKLDFAGPGVEWVKRAPLAFLPAETLAALKERLLNPKAEIASGLKRMAEDPLAGKETFLADPLGVRWIFEDVDRFPVKLKPGPWVAVGDVAFLRAIGRGDSYDIDFAKRLMEDVRRRLPEAEFAGGYVSAVAQEAAMRRDMIWQSIASTALALGFLVWFTRSFIGAHLIVLPVAMAIVWTLALGGLLLGPLTPLVVSAAAILVAQGLDFPLHFFARYRAARDRVEHLEAIEATSRSIARPMLGGVTTTLAAFAAMLLSRFPGFRQFGLLLLIGLTLCVLAALFVFPALLRPLRTPPARPPWLVRWAVAAPAWPAALLALAGLAGWGLAFAKGVRVDLDTRRALPAVDALEKVEKALGFPLNPVFALVPKTIDAESLYLAKERLRVPYAGGIPDLIPDEHAEDRARIFREDTKGWVEGAVAELRAAGVKPEPLLKSLNELDAALRRPSPTLPDLDAFPALKRAVIYEDSYVLTILPSKPLWEPAERAAFDAAARSALGESTRFYGAYHLPDHYSKALTEDFARISLLTGAIVLVLALFSVGHVGDGLRAVVPVVLAIGVTLGVLTFMGGALNLFNLIAIPIILGIGVDGGIHVMHRAREVDVRQALADVGPGIWGSTVTTLLGFGSIGGSPTPGLVSMGILVAVGAGVSMLTTFFVLPSLCRQTRQAGLSTSYNPPA